MEILDGDVLQPVRTGRICQYQIFGESDLPQVGTYGLEYGNRMNQLVQRDAIMITFEHTL